MGCKQEVSNSTDQNVEEQTEFTVILDSFEASKKIAVIKAVRAITGLGLGEAKALVEGAPQVLVENVSKSEADAIIEDIKAAGGVAIIKGYKQKVSNPEDQNINGQTGVTVILDSFDASKKIAVIKAVRAITGLGLGEAKALVEGAPQVLVENVSKSEADNIIKDIKNAGGVAIIK